MTLAIPMHPELRQVTSELEADFVRHFERQPGEGDPMMLVKYLMSDEDIERETVQAMLAAKTDPAHVYAYKKTGYLIVGDHLNRYTGAAIQEWDQAIAEFDALGAEPSDGPEAKAFDDTLASLAGEFESFIYLFGLAHDKFFNTDLLEPHDSSVAVLTAAQYQALCMSRVHRTLRSIRVLEEQRMSEDMMKLARSIYESYLHVVFVNADPQSVEYLVDAVIGLRRGTHRYKKRSDGSEDKRRIVEVSTARELPGHVSAYKMAEASTVLEDLAFFDFFYRTTSDFLHPSVFALDAYLSLRGLDPVKPHMHEEAIIFTACVTAMVAERIACIERCPDGLARDCSTVVLRVRSKLLFLLNQLGEWQDRLGANLDEIELLRIEWT